jgi:hypothetical protein
LDVGRWTLDVGVGCWVLGVGCWMLDVGCWMLRRTLRRIVFFRTPPQIFAKGTNLVTTFDNWEKTRTNESET